MILFFAFFFQLFYKSWVLSCCFSERHVLSKNTFQWHSDIFSFFSIFNFILLIWCYVVKHMLIPYISFISIPSTVLLSFGSTLPFALKVFIKSRWDCKFYHFELPWHIQVQVSPLSIELTLPFLSHLCPYLHRGILFLLSLFKSCFYFHGFSI